MGNIGRTAEGMAADLAHLWATPEGVPNAADWWERVAADVLHRANHQGAVEALETLERALADALSLEPVRLARAQDVLDMFKSSAAGGRSVDVPPDGGE